MAIKSQLRSQVLFPGELLLVLYPIPNNSLTQLHSLFPIFRKSTIQFIIRRFNFITAEFGIKDTSKSTDVMISVSRNFLSLSLSIDGVDNITITLLPK